MKQGFKMLTMLFAMALCLICAIPATLKATGSDQIKQTDVYLVLDNSGSMAEADPQRLLQESVKQFFNATPIGSDVGVVVYSGKVDYEGQLQEKKSASDTLAPYKYNQLGKGTDIPVALNKARDLLEKNKHNANRAIVLITDGANASDTDYNLKIDGKVVPVYCIYMNSGKNDREDFSRKYLAKLAKDSGTGNYIEINKAEEIEGKMVGICNSIFGGTAFDSSDDKDSKNPGAISQVVNVQKDTPTDVKYTMGKDVYTATGTIEYTDEVALKISDPSGNLIYDADDKNLSAGNDLLNVQVGNNVTTVAMYWPDPGDYTFTVSSKVAQKVSFTIVPYTANIDLKLDKTSANKGDKINATVQMKDADKTVNRIYLRVHNPSGKILENNLDMTSNGNDTFSLAVSLANASDQGDYSVVALAETKDGKLLASNKQIVNIGGPSGGAGKKSNSQPAEKSKFPIFILIPIILVILLIVALVIKKMKGKGKAPVNSFSRINVAPIAPINVKLFGANGRGMLVYANLQAVDIPDGKESELFEILQARADDRSLVSEEIKNVTVACVAPASNTLNQTLVVRKYATDDPDQLLNEHNLEKDSAQRRLSLRLDNGDELQFEWKGSKGGRR